MTRRFSPAARALLAASTLTLTAFVASAVPAAAAPDYSPDASDPRATVYAGNAVTCKDAGLAGEIVTVDVQIDESNTFIEITDVPPDVELTGIVVKGGPAYNVYGPGQRLALHAPLNNGGNIAQISHWYACGQQASLTGGEASEEDATAPEEDEESATDEADEVASDDTEAETGTDSADDGNSGDGGTELANTGFSGTGLLLVGTALLVVGLGLVFVVRTARRREENNTNA